MATSVQPVDYEWGLTFVEQSSHFFIGKDTFRKRRKTCLKQISAAERQIVNSAVDVSGSHLAWLDPAFPLLTSKSEPGDDGNRK